jgi:hypothetical protein
MPAPTRTLSKSAVTAALYALKASFYWVSFASETLIQPVTCPDLPIFSTLLVILILLFTTSLE